MNVSRTLSLLVLLTLSMFFCAEASAQNEAFKFTYSHDGLIGSGVLDGRPLGGGEYFIYAVQGADNGQPLSMLSTATVCPPTICTAAAVGGLNNGNTLYLTNPFYYDDVVYIGKGTALTGGAVLDGPGIGLGTASTIINIGGVGTPSDYYYLSGTAGSGTATEATLFSLSITPAGAISTAVPEPSTIAFIIGASVLLLLGIRRTVKLRSGWTLSA